MRDVLAPSLAPGSGAAMRAAKAWPIAALWAAFAFALPATTAHAEDDAFPSRPIRVVLGSPAGSGLDIVMRFLAPTMQEALGQPIVIDPRPGAEGIIAAELVARAPADGYTLLVATHTQLVANPVLRRELPYSVERDFVPVTLLTDHHMVVAAHPSLPARSLAELRALARGRGESGVDVGVSASTFELLAKSLAASMDAPLRTVPFNGMTPTYHAVLAGHVPLAVLDASVALDAVRAGRLRALAVGARSRLVALPEVPTFAEAGYPVLDSPLWIALVAPAGVAPATLDRLRGAVHRALGTSDVQEKLQAMAIVPRPTTGAAMAESIRAEQASFEREARRAGMPVR
jgi:tripartite-type tricarboxylate transporter receptor subunit TctC